MFGPGRRSSASKAYSGGAPILGGGAAGNALAPIVEEEASRYAVEFQGTREIVGAAELEAVSRRVNFNGFHPRITTLDGLERMSAEPGRVDRAWVVVARRDDAAGLGGGALGGEVTPVAKLLSAELPSSTVAAAERSTFDAPCRLSSLGNTNRTPWATPRIGLYIAPRLALSRRGIELRMAMQELPPE
jgi:hypothetical protein